jgi:hypothetical protein
LALSYSSKLLVSSLRHLLLLGHRSGHGSFHQTFRVTSLFEWECRRENIECDRKRGESKRFKCGRQAAD